MVREPATSGSFTGTLWFAYRQSVFFCTGRLQFGYRQPKYREPAAYSPLFSKTIEIIIRCQVHFISLFFTKWQPMTGSLYSRLPAVYGSRTDNQRLMRL